MEAYPLIWPSSYKRTIPSKRISSRFDQTMDKAQKFLRYELSRLDAKGLIISTNIRLRNEGMMYADDMRRKIDDPGVAIYFKYKGKDISMCCDQYLTIWENVYALGKGIEALRGMERWGVSDFLERAFTGFAGLPESTTAAFNIWMSLGLKEKPNTKAEVDNAYKTKAKILHPDAGGSTESFDTLNKSYKQALTFFQ